MGSIKHQSQSIGLSRADKEPSLIKSYVTVQFDSAEEQDELAPPNKRIRQNPPPPASVLDHTEGTCNGLNPPRFLYQTHSPESAERGDQKQGNAVSLIPGSPHCHNVSPPHQSRPGTPHQVRSDKPSSYFAATDFQVLSHQVEQANFLPFTSTQATPSDTATPLSEPSPSASRSEPPILPLTPENLYRIPANSSSKTASRDESQSGQETDSQASMVTMPQESPHRVRELLSRNWLFINHQEAEQVGRHVIKRAKDVLEQKRGSNWSFHQAFEVKETIGDYCGETETTFLINLMRVLLGQKRKVPIRELSEIEKEEQQNWIEREWRKDHLRARYNIDFATDSIPRISPQNDLYWNQVFKSVPRVANPKPDIAFSVLKDAFNLHKQELFNQLQCTLSGPGAYHTFFILEAKSMDSSIQEAENQCIRSGAAMVNNRRTFGLAVDLQACPAGHAEQSAKQAPQHLARPNTQQQPQGHSAQQNHYPNNADLGATIYSSDCKADTDWMAFSLAVAADQAKMFVNWALEFPNGAVHWHMHRLATCSFDSMDHLTQLHHDIDNILDWGIGPRKRKIEELADRSIQSGLVPSLEGNRGLPVMRKRGADERVN